MIAFKLAKREIKNNLKYWTFFSLNLFVGLLGFTFILMFRANVNANLELRAKTLLTSDMAITGRRALQGEEKTEVVNYLKDKVRTKASLIELYSMAKTLNGKKQSRTRLTNIKVINGHYPLVGKITLADGRTLNKELIEELRENTYVLISKEVSHQFKISLGDKLKLGKQIFEVYGILEEDSTSSMRGFNLAPKVYISLEHLKSTGLVSFGTVAWFSDFYLLNKGQDLAKLQTDLHKIITDPAIKVRLPKNSSEQIGRVLNYLSDYLGLIGVIALLISMVGASYLFQTYIFDRIRQIGILKAIGVAKGQILQSYSFIILFMGAIASLLALFISNYTLPFALDLLANWLKGSMQMIVPFEIVFVVLAVGIVINLLVCLPILNRVFRHQTNQLLADELQTKLLWADYLGYLPLLIFTWLLSVYQAHSFVIGSVFTFSLLSLFAIVLFVLPMLFKGINNWLKGRLISFPATISIGFALRVLTRNRMTSVLTILSLAMGISLMSVIGQLDASIKSELVTSEVEKPSLFLFDIQGDQYQELKKLKKKYDIPLLEPAPMIRGRLIKINGEETKRQLSDDGFRTREEETSERFNNRGVNLSYATGINSAEKIIQGRPFSGT